MLDKEARNALVVAAYTGGLSLRECAQMFTISHETVRTILKNANVAIKPAHTYKKKVKK